MAKWLLAFSCGIIGVSAAHATAPLQSAAARLLDCRKVADGAARLACYDSEAASLSGAVDTGSVVVVDKAEVRKAERARFGLSEPGAEMFVGADGARLQSITSSIASAAPDTYGKWIITLADGSRWHQIDDYTLGSAPRAGQKVVITRATLGSFKLAVAGQSAIRVRRDR